MKAKDVMTLKVATVSPDMSVRDTAAKMLESGISGIPVVDDKGQLLGVVSEGDLLRRTETGTDRRSGSWWLKLVTLSSDDARNYIKTHGTRVADVMSHPVITVTPDTDLNDVAMLLEKHRIKRVPVADNGALLGIVSRADLLRALALAPMARAQDVDDETIREHLVHHLDEQPWSRGAVNVIVTDGIVNMWGIYDDEAQHQAYLVAARETPGAKGVSDHMVPAPLV